MNGRQPFVLITMGDACGIGPEIILKSLEKEYSETCRTLVVGSFDIFRRAWEVVKSPLTLKAITNPGNGDYRPEVVNVLDTGAPPLSAAPFGEVCGSSGDGSIVAYRKAIEICASCLVKAIVTAPTNKEAIQKAGFSCNDDLELISDLVGTQDYLAILASDKYRIATVPPLHVSLKKACEALSAERIEYALDLFHSGLVSLGEVKPVIGVAALNPHAGEGGSLGDEEIRVITPAVERAKSKGWDVRGPFPADSIFFRAAKGEFNAVLTMYHDQGRIAMKSQEFGKIVIYTIGMGVPLIGIAQGTAFDIAGKGIADESNFAKALNFAYAIP